MINELGFRIKKNGEPYAKSFCKNPELIENYEKAKADTTQVWECHHRLETHFSDGTERPRDAQLSIDELIALDMYWHRSAEELIFLTQKEHIHLHQKGKSPFEGKHHSEEYKKKMSEAWKGNQYHKGMRHSDEAKRKIAEAQKGKPSHYKGKHHSNDAKRKISEANKGMRWFNDGTKNIRAKSCPNGFVPGRLLNKNKK